MSNIFMCLLMNLKNHGKIASALLKDDNYATITVRDNDSEYVVNIVKNMKVEENNNGN